MGGRVNSVALQRAEDIVKTWLYGEFWDLPRLVEPHHPLQHVGSKVEIHYEEVVVVDPPEAKFFHKNLLSLNPSSFNMLTNGIQNFQSGF